MKWAVLLILSIIMNIPLQALSADLAVKYEQCIASAIKVLENPTRIEAYRDEGCTTGQTNLKGERQRCEKDICHSAPKNMLIVEAEVSSHSNNGTDTRVGETQYFPNRESATRFCNTVHARSPHGPLSGRGWQKISAYVTLKHQITDDKREEIKAECERKVYPPVDPAPPMTDDAKPPVNEPQPVISKLELGIFDLKNKKFFESYTPSCVDVGVPNPDPTDVIDISAIMDNDPDKFPFSFITTLDFRGTTEKNITVIHRYKRRYPNQNNYYVVDVRKKTREGNKYTPEIRRNDSTNSSTLPSSYTWGKQYTTILEIWIPLSRNYNDEQQIRSSYAKTVREAIKRERSNRITPAIDLQKVLKADKKPLLDLPSQAFLMQDWQIEISLSSKPKEVLCTVEFAIAYQEELDVVASLIKSNQLCTDKEFKIDSDYILAYYQNPEVCDLIKKGGDYLTGIKTYIPFAVGIIAGGTAYVTTRRPNLWDDVIKFVKGFRKLTVNEVDDFSRNVLHISDDQTIYSFGNEPPKSFYDYFKITSEKISDDLSDAQKHINRWQNDKCSIYLMREQILKVFCPASTFRKAILKLRERPR